MVRFHDTGFDMVSLKNPIKTKKGDYNDKQKRKQKDGQTKNERTHNVSQKRMFRRRETSFSLLKRKR